MSKFTKEQLIARARENIRALECFPVQSIPQMDLALHEIALAALTAPECKGEITGENTSQPCPRCGVVPLRLNGEHYCHAKTGEID